jgi:hypothetical protein
MPRLGPPQSASIVGSLSVKIKWLEAVWRRWRNTDAHSLASRMTSLDRGMANRGARRRHCPERAGRLATRNALRVGLKLEASPPARSRLVASPRSRLGAHQVPALELRRKIL